MAEIFKSGVAKTKEKVERKSLLELRKVIQVLRLFLLRYVLKHRMMERV